MTKLDLKGPIDIIRSRLRNLAADVVPAHSEAQVIVATTTEAAAADIRSEYERHRVTGTLARRVRTRYKSPLVGMVISAAPHGSIFEKGTKSRRTMSGANRGRSPAHNVFPKVAIPHRERMVTLLKELLRSHGLEITGS